MAENVVNDLLNYNLKIVQNDNFFKFSLDSVLLAEFVKVDLKDKKLLDLCTGNAPIPMILSNTGLEITGIELQKQVFCLAKKGVIINALNNIWLINDDIKNIGNYFPGNKFDIVTCNPPYFKYDGKSAINEQLVKAIARHEIKIKLEEIIEIAYNNLRNRGKFCLVHRTERLVEIINLLNQADFGIKRMQFAFYNRNTDSTLVLIEAKKHTKNNIKVINPLFVQDYGRNT